MSDKTGSYDSKSEHHHPPVQHPGSANPPATTEPSPSRKPTEVVVVENAPRLSADQHRTAQQLLSLYQSLAGDQPGRYAPQSQLDTAGRFSRPAFPGRDSMLSEGRRK